MKVSLFSVHKNNKNRAKRKPAGKSNLRLTFLSRFSCNQFEGAGWRSGSFNNLNMKGNQKMNYEEFKEQIVDDVKQELENRGEYSCVMKPWFRSNGNLHSGYGNRFWLAWLPFIRNRANVKPRAALRGVSRLYFGEVSCILDTCQSVSKSPDSMDIKTGIFKQIHIPQQHLLA